MSKTKVEHEEYKGHPLIVILEPRPYGEELTYQKLMSFGKKKAKAILNHIEDIRKFVGEEND